MIAQLIINALRAFPHSENIKINFFYGILGIPTTPAGPPAMTIAQDGNGWTSNLNNSHARGYGFVFPTIAGPLRIVVQNLRTRYAGSASHMFRGVDGMLLFQVSIRSEYLNHVTVDGVFYPDRPLG